MTESIGNLSDSLCCSCGDCPDCSTGYGMAAGGYIKCADGNSESDRSFGAFGADGRGYQKIYS